MGLTWLAIGDSITNGTGATNFNNSYIYQTRLGLLNAKHPHYLVRSALGGQTSGTMLDLHKEKGGKCDPDLITIMLGTNDIGTGVSTATFQTNLSNLIDEVNRKLVVGKGKIVLITMPWRNDASTSLVPSYNTIVQQVGASKNIPVCDIYPAFNSASDLSDAVHPNDSGHMKIANILIPFINNLDVWNKVRSRD